MASVENRVTLFWFRRDLRLNDNAGMYNALKEKKNVLPLFIFDVNILDKLEDPDDARVTFIYQTISEIKLELNKLGSDLLVRFGNPLKILQDLEDEFSIDAIYTNHDYEPYARARDGEVARWAAKTKIEFNTFKDQCLFEKEEILTGTGKPYTVFTPYKSKVLSSLSSFYLKSYPTKRYFKSLLKVRSPEKLLTLEKLGFRASPLVFPEAVISVNVLKQYEEARNFPALSNGTSHVGLHLRFGTVSIRTLAREAKKYSATWLSELIWRDFFMQILWHFPEVENQSFRKDYDKIAWRKSKGDFKKWCEGRTGYALVDAGMRELNATGYMHNRVRMVTASFLCKHLLIHWSEGERYFARKLLDYDLAANNGNWQWSAGSGCDAAPYFRIFNPITQAKKFDPDEEYIRKWVPEYGTDKYHQPMIDHAEARGRCLAEYNKALRK